MLIEQYGALCPVYILGDLNVQVPDMAVLHKKWYKSKGYNKHSKIVYNFSCDNNMTVLDQKVNQPVPYTYFSHTSAHYTWIDHCFSVGQGASRSVCKILEHDDDNVSDHLPLNFLSTLQNL